MAGNCTIVTGATSGIGRAAARKFAEQGHNVFAVGRNPDALVALRDECSELPGELFTHQADITDTKKLDPLVESAIKRFDTIDVLVNAAGIIEANSIETTGTAKWGQMMDINLNAVFELTRRCVPHLIASKGCIVNVSSVAGTRAFPNVLAYCVSKAALDQFTRCVALELAEKQVRVNAVNPGVVRTELHKRSGMNEKQYAEFLEHSKTTHPLGRVGEPREVAELIYFLASGPAGWITGKTYEIDGGRGQTCAR